MTTAAPQPPAEANGAAPPLDRRLLLLAMSALGVVYGDIGTSPLYSVRECFDGPHAVPVSTVNVLGVLSLIFWVLIVIVTVKYLIFILRADNHGEGGILALAALVTPLQTSPVRRLVVVLLGLFGAALLYADGMITPAISVLSAVDGLSVITPLFEPYIDAITVAILVLLFLLQRWGTSRVGSIFGPVLLAWFATIAVLGLVHVVRQPAVLQAVLPHHGALFFWHNGWPGLLVLGTVFLVVTGGEALYADLGHFGTRPIRITWFAVVLPCLLLNYFGQGALLLGDSSAAANPFFRMAPSWSLYLLVPLATAAAVIASQAVITGAFSLTLQAVQLGYAPRLQIDHTSHEQAGQIYVPFINWCLMLACIALVLGFESSSNLAAAYGVAITVTMVITTLLFFVLAVDQWKWSLPAALAVSGGFLLVDLSFLIANLSKVGHGGWLPLIVAGGIFTLMTTWFQGRRLLDRRMRERYLPLESYLAQLSADPPLRVPGTAVFLFGNPVGTPPALRQNVLHNKVLHRTVIIVRVVTADVPHVRLRDRARVEEIGDGFWRARLTYGFMDEPNIPLTLAQVALHEHWVSSAEVSYFVGRETLLPAEGAGMWLWRERLFSWMNRNSQSATSYYRLPPQRVIEVGAQVEI